MKKGVNIAKIIEKIIEFGTQMGGVFSTADLASIIGGGSDLYNQRMINKLVRDGIITRVLKGFYTTKNCDLWILSARINNIAYVSMDSALARHGLTGSIPQRSLSVVYGGRKRTISTSYGNIHYYSIKPPLFFGFSKLPSGVNMADPEKAFIDLLYFYVKGGRFLIDPIKDVNLDKLERKKLLVYLKKYKNPKFVKFVRGLL